MPMRFPIRVLLWIAVMATATVGAWAALGHVQAKSAAADLFHGRAALQAQLRGQQELLPASATACSNCHDQQGGIGSPLGPKALLQALPRRGGPSSRYDAASFCQLLRTGVDPASVMIDMAMPLYTLTDHQCALLWKHAIATRASP